jgi:hypothetical protein
VRVARAVAGSEPTFQGKCSQCGRGGEQVGDLVIETPPPESTGFALTEEGQILVSERVARAMIEEQISGCILRTIRDTKGRTQHCFQVLPLHTLPPLCIPPTRIEKDPQGPCGRCGRGGLTVNSLLYFDLTTDELCDLNVCREALGGVADLAGGVVVSQRLFRLLCAAGALEAAVEPIVLV